MFQIQNVPIVIEPGVAAIEAEFFVTERPGKSRSFPVHLFRISPDGEAAGKLPFIAAIKTPHIFGLAHNPDNSIVLVVYDSMGRINTVYTKDQTGKSWDKRLVADEHAGKAVKQFSVRYFFGSEKSRDEFMSRIDNVISAIEHNTAPAPEDIQKAFRLLSRSRVSPVALPVAVAKGSLKQVKI